MKESQPTSLTHKTMVGLLWMFSGTGALGLLQFFVLLVLARLLTPADFGVVSAALLVVNFSTIFSQLGVGPAIVQRPNLTSDHLRTGFTVTLLFSLGFALLIFVGAPAIARFFQMPSLPDVLRTLSLLFPLTGPSVVAQVLMQRELRFRRLATIEVVSHLFGYSLVGITLALLGMGVWALVAASLTKAGVQSALLLINQPFPKRLQLNRQAFGELMFFGGGFTLGRVLNYLALQGDYLVVGRALGPAALGIYSRAYELMVTPASLFGRVLDTVLFSAMAKVQTEAERLGNAYRRGLYVVGLFALPSGMAAVVLAPELIVSLLGPKWLAVVAPLQILALGMFFRTSYKVSESVVRASGAVYQRAWRQGVYALAVVGGSALGARWGLSGVAWGVLFAITVNFLLMTQLGLRLAKMSWRTFWMVHLPSLLLTLIGTAVMMATVQVLRELELSPLIILSAAGAAFAATAALLMKAFPERLLGQDGRWVLRALASHLPRGRPSRRLPPNATEHPKKG